MSPRVFQAHLDARRRDILSAAFHCFARKGLHSTTMQEIAAEAGLSAGALYRYFPSKESLIETLAVESAERRSQIFDGLEFRGGSNVLADVITEMMRGLNAEAAEASVRLDIRLWAEALDRQDVGDLVRNAFASLREPVAEFIRGAQKIGRIRGDVDPKAVGRIVASLMTGLELQRAYDTDLNLDAYREAVRSLLSGLSPERQI